MADHEDSYTLDRPPIRVVPLDTVTDRTYWHSRTPKERLAHTEYLRQLNYGYDPATARVERILTVIEQRTT